MGKRQEEMFHQKRIYRWQINVKRCSTSFAMEKTQIKTTRHHYTPIEMVKTPGHHNYTAIGTVKTPDHCTPVRMVKMNDAATKCC